MASNRPRFVLLAAALVALTASLLAPAASAAGEAAATADKVTTLTFSMTLAAESKDESTIGRNQYGYTVLTGTSTIGGSAVSIERLSVYQYASGSGPIGGFLTLSWPDGSTLAMSAGGQTQQEANGAHVYATLRVFAANGRWKGFDGVGLMEGVRKGPIGTPVVYRVTIHLQK
jgi:hypothetical protein